MGSEKEKNTESAIKKRLQSIAKTLQENNFEVKFGQGSEGNRLYLKSVFRKNISSDSFSWRFDNFDVWITETDDGKDMLICRFKHDVDSPACFKEYETLKEKISERIMRDIKAETGIKVCFEKRTGYQAVSFDDIAKMVFLLIVGGMLIISFDGFYSNLLGGFLVFISFMFFLTYAISYIKNYSNRSQAR